MPTYSHICSNKECNHEWEDMYSIKADPPKICPKCNQETAKRVINSTSIGVVELTGQELVDKLKSDGKTLAKEAYKSEKQYSNLIGESRYQNIQQSLDKGRHNRKR